jgi:hypothetical protein
MPIKDEKDLLKCFINNNPPHENKNEKINLVRGAGEMPPDFEFDGYEDEKNVNINKEEILIMLVAWKSEHFEEYKKFFAEYGVRIIAVSSEEEFLSFVRILPVNGVVADLTSGNENYSEKTLSLIKELELNYPFLRMKFNSLTNTVEYIHADTSVQSLEDFIDKKAKRFTARTLRSNKRIPISLNVEISPEKEFVRVERSITCDVSGSGLFILAMSPMWDNAKKCFISIKEFHSESLVECNVVRQIRWGEKPFKNPGIGVEISTIHESLQDDFNMLLEKWRLF